MEFTDDVVKRSHFLTLLPVSALFSLDLRKLSHTEGLLH